MRWNRRNTSTSTRLPSAVAIVVVACTFSARAPRAAGPAADAAVAHLKLPPDAIYQHHVGPDSAVVFSHRTHVAFAGSRCTACHPQTFRILAPTKLLSHREMDAGLSCGACHDGRHAFGVRDSLACASCHSGRRAVSPAGGEKTPGGARAGARVPAAITYSRSGASPGPVAFLHATHLSRKLACASCHPRPFAMKAAETHAAPLHEPSACGTCHDGAKAFGVDDPEACARCHAARGEAP